MSQKELASYKDVVIPALISKVEEFHLLGYEKVTLEDIWACLLHMGRRQKHWHLYEVVAAIMKIKNTDYMNYLTMQAYQNPNWLFQDLEKLEGTISGKIDS